MVVILAQELKALFEEGLPNLELNIDDELGLEEIRRISVIKSG
jgi:hypothetical protein